MVTTIVIATRLSDTEVSIVYVNDLHAHTPSIMTIVTDTPHELMRAANIPTVIGQTKHYTV